MKTRRLVVIGSVMVLTLGGVLAWSAPTPAKEDKPGKTYPSADGKFQFMLYKLSMKSDLDLTGQIKSKHTFSVEGSIHPPEELDVVGFTEGLITRSALADNNFSVLDPKYKPQGKDSQYNAVINGWAKVSAKDTPLTQNAYTIKTLGVESTAVIAKKREEKAVSPTVMEEFNELAPGFKARISSLQMANDRTLTIMIDYTRAQPQATPFIESIHALNNEKQDIGGARWSLGSPLGAKGKITAAFPVAKGEAHTSLRLVMVTEFEFQPVSFEVNDAFQQ
jgi:hypothetical protein